MQSNDNMKFHRGNWVIVKNTQKKGVIVDWALNINSDPNKIIYNVRFPVKSLNEITHIWYNKDELELDKQYHRDLKLNSLLNI